MYDSRQIRPPIYSLKQSKLRKRRVIRYAIMYFALFFLFLALIIAPIVAGSKANGAIANLAGKLPGYPLAQPTGLNNNLTVSTYTGYWAGGTPGRTAASATATSTRARLALRNW